MIQMHKQTSSYATLHVETNDNNDTIFNMDALVQLSVCEKIMTCLM